MGQYISTWYNTDNGLPQNSIKDITKDKYGFIWLATENGIIKYDGQSFSNYNDIKVKNLHFDIFYGNISADSIFCVNDYMQDRILINRRSVKVSKTGNFSSEQRLNLEPNVMQIHKNDISKDFNKNVTYYIKTSTSEYSFKNNTINYSVNGKSTSLSIPVNNMHDLFVDNDILYIIDKAHRKTYSVDRGRVSLAENSSIINDPSTFVHWHEANNQTFIINNGHIYLLEVSNGRLNLKFLIANNSIQKNSITSIYYDKIYNKLYLASPIKGLNIIEPEQFKIAKKNIPFQTDVSYSSLPFSANTIIDSRGNVLNNEGIVKKYNFKCGDQYMMLFDSFQNIIIGHTTFLTTYTKKSGYTQAYTVNLNKRIIGLFNKADLHAAATVDSSDTLIHFFENDQFKKIKYSWRFPGAVKSILRYGTNRLLVGSSDGLYIIDATGKNKQKLINTIDVKSIIRTSDGEVWVTTRKEGYFMVRDKKVIKMPLDRNLFLSNAHFIQYDSLGNYWISSDNGLFKISKKQLLQYVTTKKVPEYYRFTKETGLLVNEFNGGILPAAYTLQDGEFVFPSMEGFVFFQPKNISSYYPEKSAIFVERARINNKEINFDKQLTVENSSDQIEIFIDFPYYSDVSNTNVQVRIKGMKKRDWQHLELKDGKKIALAGLDPGIYTVEFRVLVSEDGKYEYRNVELEIKPFFYQTISFKVIVIMTIILSLGSFVRKRSKLLDKRNKALKRTVYSMSSELKDASDNLHIMKNEMTQLSEYQEKLIETISHDISTPVKFIVMLSQKLHNTDNLEFQKKYFDSIHKASEELYKFTLDLKEYNTLYKTDTIYTEDEYTISEILIEKKNLFQEIAKNSNNIISVKADHEILCNINRNILSCIIHNIIDNAVKNTNNGTIAITLKEKTITETTIIVEDTGCGMSPEQIQYYNDLFSKTNQMAFKNYGLGLHMVIHLIKKINAQIMFCKGLICGTTVTITLKK
nr:ATP-binding protein [uncultured Chryseobacterium sp.]